MFGRQDPQVLVVGAGPVGQLAALALAAKEIPVRIADTGIWACSHSYALALHPKTLSILDRFGLADTVLERSYPVRHMGLYEGGEYKARIRIGDPEDPRQNMAVLRQDVLESILEKALNEAGVKIGWRHDVADITSNVDHAVARVNQLQRESRGYVVARSEWMVHKTEKLDVPFLIGADGYDSEARRSMGIPFEEAGPAEHYAVFEFETDADLDHEVKVVFTRHGKNVLWPLPGGFCRWSFQLSDLPSRSAHRDKERLLLSPGLPEHALLDDSHLREYIHERVPWFEGSVKQVTWRMAVRFERRLASRFGLHRVWLAGDAAHLTGPVGIQSMNVGLAEALDLSHRISRVLREGALPREMEDYHTEWHAEWSRLSGLSGGLKPVNGCDPWVVGRADAILSSLPAYGEDLRQLAGQIGLAF